MGEVNEQGELSCFYHGWSFGKDGECTDVPTMALEMEAEAEAEAEQERPLRAAKKEAKKAASSQARASLCATHYAAAEHNGMVWVWGGDVLEADPRLLPTQREGEKTLYVDTALDYNVDWAYIVENNLDSPHIYWLHDGASFFFPSRKTRGLLRKADDAFRRFRISALRLLRLLR